MGGACGWDGAYARESYSLWLEVEITIKGWSL